MFFLHALNDRTIADIVCTLAEETALLGHETIVVAASIANDAVRRPVGVRLIDLRCSSGGTWRSIWRLRQAVTEHRPDALYAHGNGPARAAIIATRFLAERPRVVTAEHNHYSSYAWRLRWIRRMLNRLLLPHADHVVGVAPEIVEDLEQQFPGVVGRTSFIPEPLTRWRRLEQLAREAIDHPWFLGDGVPVVVSVANIHPRKDPATLIRAVIIANRRSPTPIRLAVIGRALDADLLAQLEHVVAEADMADRFAFLGFQANPLPYVRGATVFALTSTNEGLPVGLLEAMALGVPMVSTDAPSGPRFLLEGGRYGRLVPVGSHDAVADAILELVANPEERARLAELGRERADLFRPSRVAEKYLAIGR